MTNETCVVPVELLPCPFCGGKPTVSRFPGAHNVWCSNQPTNCDNRSMFTPERWNRRTALGEPVYQVSNGVDGWEDVDVDRYTARGSDPEGHWARTLYRQPATAKLNGVTPNEQ